MNFEELRAGYNDLRTAAFGRGGLERNVSPRLASDILSALQSFGAWYPKASARVWAGPVDLLPADLNFGVEREAAVFAGRLRALTRAAASEGVKFSEAQLDVVESVPEQLERYAANAASTFKALAVALLFGIGVALFSRRRS